MIYAYIRVSTDKQTVENQRFEIERYCERESIKVDEWVSEVVSGTKNAKERALGDLLPKLRKGDTLICAELSRLGRRIVDLLTTVNLCFEKNVRLVALKNDFDNANPSSKIYAMALGMCAEIERDLISSRVKEALAKRKADGVKLGRKEGFRLKEVKLDVYKEKIACLKYKGFNGVEIAKMLNIPQRTLYDYLKRA